MEIITRKIAELKPADYNPRKKSEHVIATVRDSLRNNGWLAPVVVNKNPDRLDIIVGGHRRLEAATANGELEVPTIEVNLTMDQEKRLNLQLNAQEQFDQRTLASLVAEMHTADPKSVETLGLSSKQLGDLLYANKYMQGKTTGILANKFLIPPFSVFDAKQGAWQDRKREWLELLGNLSESREATLAGTGNNVMMMYGGGTSQFDPVTAEVIYSWFTPKGGVIFDPFAGEQTKAVVATVLGFQYHAVEVRPEQVAVNQSAIDKLGLTELAKFYTGDSTKLDEFVPADLEADLIFTSPPYYDLEVYSKQSDDISAKQTYEQFIENYRTIFEKSAAHLKPNRFVVLKLGDVRDENGMYRDFLGDNIRIMKDLGFKLYNEIIYLQALATAPHRAERNMTKRKVVKVHQNIYTFYKGSEEYIKNPQLLDIHEKVLTFFKGDPTTIPETFPNPPNIQRDALHTSAMPPEGYNNDEDDKS